MSRRDAMAVCQDPRASGRNHGLHWTADGVQDLRASDLVIDNGRYDPLLADHDVTIVISRRCPFEAPGTFRAPSDATTPKALADPQPDHS